MKKLILLSAVCTIIFLVASCDKQRDHYYGQYLNESEIAKPGKPDSLQILPGNLRAIVKFKVSPDRRVSKYRLDYYTSLNSTVSSSYLDVKEEEYGKYKEVQIMDIPEATLFVSLTGFSANGDSSNTATSVGVIYGSKYHNLTVNRVFSRIEDVKVVEEVEKRMIFLALFHKLCK